MNRFASLSLGLALIALAALARAADEPQEPIPAWEDDPFDRIVLNADNQSAVLKVELLPFPTRVVPPKANWAGFAPLKFQLVDKGTQEFEVNWTAIERIELYENILIADAQKATQAGQFDDAFACYEALQRRAPQWPGLREGLTGYYFASAGAAFRKDQLHEAVTMLDEAFALEPQNAGVAKAAEAVTRKLVERYVAAKDYRAARDFLARTKAKYGAAQQGALDEWAGKLSTQAAERKQSAEQALAGGKLREAHVATREMLALWPELAGASQLAASVREKYPVLTVGVTMPWTERGASPIQNPGQRRAARIAAPRAMEFTGYGPDGGEYACRVGTLAASPDRTIFTFELRASAGSNAAADLAAAILAPTRPGDPRFYRGWNELLAEVAVPDARHVAVKLRRAGLRPEPFLAAPLGPAAAPDASARPLTALERALVGGPYVPVLGGESVRIALAEGVAPATPYQPREVEERTYPRMSAAAAALARGEVDLVDHLSPRAALALKDAKTVAVEAYALPVLHVLVPNYARPLPAHRTYRRAIEYALDRAAIVKEALVPADDPRAARVISGPLPAARSTDDPLAYGYNEQLAPRPYEPRLSVALRGTASAELVAAGRKSAAEDAEKLVLAYPASETARACVGAMAKQLKLAAIECELRELAPGRTQPEDANWDFLYAEWVIAEPLTDLVEIFRPGGLVPADSPYLALALARVGEARNWNEAGERLRELHRVCQQELPVISLWQVRQYYAFRKDLRGPAPRAAALYQGLEQWRVPEGVPGLAAGG